MADFDFGSIDAEKNIIPVEEGYDGFIPVEGKPVPSINSLAAKMAIIEGSVDPIESFRQISQQISEVGIQDLANQVLGPIKEGQDQSYRQVFVEALADPALLMEQKEALVKYYNQTQSMAPTVNQAFAEQMVLAEGDTSNPREEEERVRTWEETLGRWEERVAFKQKAINAVASQVDDSLLGMGKDLVEHLVPHLQEYKLQNISTEVTKDDFSLINMALAGEEAVDIKNAFARMSHEEQMAFTQTLYDYITANGGIAIQDQNGMHQLHVMKTILEQGYYTEEDRYIDNLFGILDVTGTLGALAGFVRRAAKGVGSAARTDVPKDLKEGIEELEGQARQEDVLALPAPNSPGKIAEELNPEVSRKMNNLAASDETGEIAEVVYGTDKNAVIANSNLPQLAKVDDIADVKPENPNKYSGIDAEVHEDILEAAFSDAQIVFDKAEKAAARARFRNEIEATSNVFFKVTNSTFKSLDNGVLYRATYGPKNGMYRTYEEAVNKIEKIFRERGVTEKDNLTVLKNVGGELVPIKSAKEVEGNEAGFLVRMDYEYNFRPEDRTKDFEVKNIWASKYVPKLIHSKFANIERWILDADSIHKGQLTKSAAERVEASSLLEKGLGDRLAEVSNMFKRVSSDQRDKLYSFMHKANNKGIKFNKENYAKEKVSEFEPILKAWKRLTDTLYILENRDYVRTLKRHGFKYFVNKNHGTSLLASKVPDNKVKKEVFEGNKLAKVFDMDSNEYITIHESSVAKLRKDAAEIGGELEFGKLVDGLVTGDDVVKITMTRNTTSTSFSRQIGDNELVLNYREGYFPIKYRTSWILEEFDIRPDGTVDPKSGRAVGSADSIKDVKDKEAELNATSSETKKHYRFREPTEMSMDPDLVNFKISVRSGRSAQRMRGDMLENISEYPVNLDDDYSHIADPMEAMSDAIRSIARRTSLRDWLDVTKSRFMQQYRHLAKGVEEDGPPITFDELTRDHFLAQDRPDQRKEAAKALQVMDYINQIQNGYRAMVDDIFQAGMHGLASELGERGFKKTETKLREGLMASTQLFGRGPSAMAKTWASRSLLTMAPLRMWILQSSNLARLFAFSGVHMARDVTQGISLMTARQLHHLNKDVSTIKKLNKDSLGQYFEDGDFINAYNDLEKSGLIAGMDRQNIAENALDTFGEKNLPRKALEIPGKFFHAVHRFGFDVGESLSRASAFSTFRNEAIRAKKAEMKSQGKKVPKVVTLSGEELAEVTAKVLNVLAGPNQAGQMPYTKGSLGAVLQFLEYPHKTLLQYAANQQLKPNEKARLFFTDMLMYGTFAAGPVGMTGYALVEMLGGDPTTEEGRALAQTFEDGAMGLALNSLFSSMAGEPKWMAGVDTDSIDPRGLDSVARLVDVTVNAGLGEVFASTPGYTSIGRVGNFISTLGRVFTPNDDYQDVQELNNVFLAGAKIFQGANHAVQAAFMFQYEKALSSTGKILDDDVNKAQAIAKMFGFSPEDIAKKYEYMSLINDRSYYKTHQAESDIQAWYKEVRKFYMEQALFDSDSPQVGTQDFLVKVLSAGRSVWGDSHPEFERVINNEFRKELEIGDEGLFGRLRTKMNLLTPEELRTLKPYFQDPVYHKAIETHAQTLSQYYDYEDR